MRAARWVRRVLFMAVLCIAVVEAVVILNLARINERNYRALKVATTNGFLQKDTLLRLRREAVVRASLYNELVKRDLLVDGMVIHLNEDGEMDGECDSLMFSSLRYASLRRLGLNDEADEAWQGILNSHTGGQWFRHPRCRDLSLSRDMLMGLLIALDENPKGAREIVLELLKEIDRRGGYFSDGPFFVSYLSPGIAGLLRNLAVRHEVPFDAWPWALKQSFSSIEFDAMFVREGFESHLAALGTWLEWRMMQRSAGFNPRSMLGELQTFVDDDRLNSAPPMDHERLLWISSDLARKNQGNLFFQWLELEVSQRDDDEARVAILNELLNSPQFPGTRLPQDCDHDADYVWQRKTAELLPVKKTCRATWNGVDFMWMAGLLLEEPGQNAGENPPLPLAH